jgi:hypothetical protein
LADHANEFLGVLQDAATTALGACTGTVTLGKRSARTLEACGRIAGPGLIPTVGESACGIVTIGPVIRFPDALGITAAKAWRLSAPPTFLANLLRLP